MYLVTKWFGTFLFDDSKLVDHRLFPDDFEELGLRLISMRNGEILDDEKEMVSVPVIVNEPRLSPLGTYDPHDEVFNSINLDCKDFEKSLIKLQQAVVYMSDYFISRDLEKKDYQIAQRINAIDELVQMSNIIKERLTSWSLFPTTEKDLEPLHHLLKIIEEKVEMLQNQISQDIKEIAPNTTQLIGPLLTARLVAVAGTMKRLAFFPASTIQLLGAEKAFFRFKKEGGRPPKHGLIFQHPLINNAPRKLRGRIARLLASKIILAVRADVFTGRNISNELHQMIEDGVKEIRKNK